MKEVSKGPFKKYILFSLSCLRFHQTTSTVKAELGNKFEHFYYNFVFKLSFNNPRQVPKVFICLTFKTLRLRKKSVKMYRSRS